VANVHENEVFGRIDELLAGMEEGAPARRSRDCARLMRLPPKTVYEAIGLSASVDRMRQWFADL
jgi:hypothetical protein